MHLTERTVTDAPKPLWRRSETTENGSEFVRGEFKSNCYLSDKRLMEVDPQTFGLLK